MYHSSIKMAPSYDFYVIFLWYVIVWFEGCESGLIELDLVRKDMEKLRLVKRD